MTIDDYDFEEILPPTPENLVWRVKNGWGPGQYLVMLMEKRKTIFGGIRYVKIDFFPFSPEVWGMSGSVYTAEKAQEVLNIYKNARTIDTIIEKH